MTTEFNKFLLKAILENNESFEQFIKRQIALRELFKKRGEDISWLLDLSHILHIIKNQKHGKHFKINKKLLEDALVFCKDKEELKMEHDQIVEFLR